MTTVPYTSKIERPGSSAITAIYYDEPTSRLYIEFVKQGFAGSIAGYSDIPVNIFNQFARAESIGKFYNRVFLGYDPEGYDMPPTPEMVDRLTMEPEPVDEEEEWSGGPSYSDNGTVHQVTAIVNVYGADTPGMALDMVLRELEDYNVVRSEVTER